MNNQRRRELQEALNQMRVAIDTLVQARDIIESVQGQELEAYEMLPEGFQESERGQQMSENADTLENIASSINDQIDEIEDCINSAENM